AIKSFLEIYKGTLTDFSSALKSHQEASARTEKFTQSCNNGAIPKRVTRQFGVPPFQFSKEAELVKDDRLKEAAKAMDDALVQCHTAAVTYLKAAYALNEEVYGTQADVKVATASFQNDIEAYVGSISSCVGGTDTAVWLPYLAAIMRALECDLRNASWDFADQHKRATEEAAAKATAVALAKESAEMANSAKPIGELVKE
ncbi:hypothetical protein CPB85DRAFT_1171451, partial [Mucidula mucida]